VLSFDTETDRIAPARLAPELACISYSDGENDNLVHWTDSYKTARWLLEQEVTTANGPFDLAVVWAAHPDLRDLIFEGLVTGRYHDVLIRQKLMDIGAGRYRRIFRKLPGEEKARPLHYGLSDLHCRYYGTFMEKDEWRLRYGELRQFPLEAWPQGARLYATYDAVVTARIHDLQIRAAIEQGHTHNLHDEAAQMRAAFALYIASCWGIRADAQQVRRVIDYIDKEQPELAAQLEKVGLARYDAREGVYKRKEKAAKALMYQAVGDSGELTDTGYEKVKGGLLSKEQALAAGYIKIDEEWCEVSKNPDLIAYFHFRQNQLLRTKLGDIYDSARAGLPIQTRYEVLMETGRTSSSKSEIIPNSMGVQNPPRKPVMVDVLDEYGQFVYDKKTGKKKKEPAKDERGREIGGVRECFIARDGCTLLAADFGQAELVSLAEVTYAAFGMSKMRDLLNADMDIHVDFGKEVWSVKEGLSLSYDKAWELHKAKDAKMKDFRQLAKAADFGFPGGLGWASFQSYARKAWGVELTGEEAKQLKIYWLRHFPEMRLYFKWISQLVELGGGLTDIQAFMTGRWRGRCFYTQACNNMFQALTADAAKAAFFEVTRLCYTVKSSDLYGCRPLLFVHDEIIAEGRREQAPYAAKELERVMVNVYQEYTPHVKITAKAHLMDRWSKDAEAVTDERGKLIPWEPPQAKDEREEHWLEGLKAA
jgi:DNA polymerase family A